MGELHGEHLLSDTRGGGTQRESHIVGKKKKKKMSAVAEAIFPT